MKSEIAEEIDDFFEDLEKVEHLATDGETRTVFAVDIQKGDIIVIAGKEYYSTRRRLFHSPSGLHIMRLGFQEIGTDFDGDFITINSAADTLFDIRRPQ